MELKESSGPSPRDSAGGGTSIWKLSVSTHTKTALERLGCATFSDVSLLSDLDIMCLPDVGDISMTSIRSSLRGVGLNLLNDDGWTDDDFLQSMATKTVGVVPNTLEARLEWVDGLTPMAVLRLLHRNRDSKKLSNPLFTDEELEWIACTNASPMFKRWAQRQAILRQREVDEEAERLEREARQKAERLAEAECNLAQTQRALLEAQKEEERKRAEAQEEAERERVALSTVPDKPSETERRKSIQKEWLLSLTHDHIRFVPSVLYFSDDDHGCLMGEIEFLASSHPDDRVRRRHQDWITSLKAKSEAESRRKQEEETRKQEDLRQREAERRLDPQRDTRLSATRAAELFAQFSQPRPDGLGKDPPLTKWIRRVCDEEGTSFQAVCNYLQAAGAARLMDQSSNRGSDRTDLASLLLAAKRQYDVLQSGDYETIHDRVGYRDVRFKEAGLVAKTKTPTTLSSSEVLGLEGEDDQTVAAFNELVHLMSIVKGSVWIVRLLADAARYNATYVNELVGVPFLAQAAVLDEAVETMDKLDRMARGSK